MSRVNGPTLLRIVPREALDELAAEAWALSDLEPDPDGDRVMVERRPRDGETIRDVLDADLAIAERWGM